MTVVAGLMAGALVVALAAAVAAARRATAAHTARRRVGHRPRPRGAPSPRWSDGLATLAGEPPRRLVLAIDAAAVAVPAVVVWRAWLGGLAFAGLGGAVVGGTGLALVAMVAAGSAPVLVLHGLRHRRDRLVERALPDALEAVARSLRSGASLPAALAEAGGAAQGPTSTNIVADDLAAVVQASQRGLPLVAALDRWPARRPLPGVRLAVAALALAAEAGGAQARAVDGVASTLRDRLALGREVRALASQARLSALVIAAAPLGFTALATATDPRTATFLFRTRLGLACLAMGLALDGLAAAWMGRITRMPA